MELITQVTTQTVPDGTVPDGYTHCVEKINQTPKKHQSVDRESFFIRLLKETILQLTLSDGICCCYVGISLGTTVSDAFKGQNISFPL